MTRKKKLKKNKKTENEIQKEKKDLKSNQMPLIEY